MATLHLLCEGASTHQHTQIIPHGNIKLPKASKQTILSCRIHFNIFHRTAG